MKGYAMLDWVQQWPDWLQAVWFFYITFHDLVQWGVLALIGMTVWGKRKRQQKHQATVEALAVEIKHIHDEVHKHIEEDSSFHENLGQRGMSRGKDVEPTE